MADDPNKTESSSGAGSLQDLINKAQSLGDQGEAWQKSMVVETTKSNQTLKRQNRILLVAVFLLVASQIWSTYRALFISGPNIESIKETVEGPLSNANAKLDDIILFIEEVKAAQDDSSTVNPEVQRVFKTVFTIKDILCEDPKTPEIVEACK